MRLFCKHRMKIVKVYVQHVYHWGDKYNNETDYFPEPKNYIPEVLKCLREYKIESQIHQRCSECGKITTTFKDGDWSDLVEK
jgi:hypothetical protein